MVIDDHINLTGPIRSAGPNDDRFGPRVFLDMSAVYSSQLRTLADEAAKKSGVALAHGVYAAMLGPSYETPAEIRYLRAIGADAVGMSTVPEAIVARHMGIDVLGISCITNMAAGVLPQPLDHAEVMETAPRVRGQFIALLEGIIGRLALKVVCRLRWSRSAKARRTRSSRSPGSSPSSWRRRSTDGRRSSATRHARVLLCRASLVERGRRGSLPRRSRDPRPDRSPVRVRARDAHRERRPPRRSAAPAARRSARARRSRSPHRIRSPRQGRGPRRRRSAQEG